MSTIKLSTGDAKAYFRYGVDTRGRITTILTIYNVADGQVLTSGVAACSLKDVFVKAQGREMAVRITLHLSEPVRFTRFNKADRAAIVQWYERSHKNPWPLGAKAHG